MRCFGTIARRLLPLLSPRCANHVEQNSWCSARDLDREGICECHFPETVEASRGAGVTVIVLGFILYEVTKIVTHAGDTTTSVPRTGEASRAL
jgi:hypothetical protein